MLDRNNFTSCLQSYTFVEPLIHTGPVGPAKSVVPTSKG